MARLFSYVVASDYGSAPNPYGGWCSLVICKPVIRRVAEEGDWVVGFGSVNSPIGDISDRVVYAMKIQKPIPMHAYEAWCGTHAPAKFPDPTHDDYARRVGDCIFDYSAGEPPAMRPSVHNEGNRETDLGGVNALVSDHFWYFGDKPVPLPDRLLPISDVNRGHKSNSNDPFVDDFAAWISEMDSRRNTMQGEPQLQFSKQDFETCRSTCASADRRADEEDEQEERKKKSSGGIC